MKGTHDIAQLAFLEGTWESQAESSVLEMTFTAARAGSMLGTVRETAAGRLGYFEFLRFEVADESLEFSPYPEGRSTGTYALIEIGGEPRPRVVFASPDGTRVARFELDERRELVAAVEGLRDGARFRHAWTFCRR